MEVAQTPLSGRVYTDSLILGPMWAGKQLAFSFPTSATQFTGYNDGEPLNNFEALNSGQQGVVQAVFASISSFTNLTFMELTGGQASTATLRFGMSDATETAHAYLPSPSERGGDSWYNNNGGAYDGPVRGNYGWYTFMHEIGHALGLGHAHEANGVESAMPIERDSMSFTVMSYRSSVGGDLGGYRNEKWGFAQSYMMEDIAALQFLYGANFNHNASDTHYRWNPLTGEMSINGVGQGAPGANRVFMTIWDGGGNDTYDFSNYIIDGSVPFGGPFIDLRPGQWVGLPPGQTANTGGHEPRNIANALLYNGDTRSLIENAIGSSGTDHIYGNEVANMLDGGPGNDRLEGNGGDDLLIGGPGNDSIDGGEGNNHLVGGSGMDTLVGGTGHDWLEGGDDEDALHGFAGDDLLEGGRANDWLVGYDGADRLFGGDGDDRLDGRRDGDTLHGGAGSDELLGGAGADVFLYLSASESVGAAPDWLGDFEHGLDKIDLRQIATTTFTYHAGASNSTSVTIGTLQGSSLVLRAAGVVTASDFLLGELGNRTIVGTPGDDYLEGGPGSDTLYGYAGSDVLVGGAGRDTVNGGHGSDTGSYASSPRGVIVDLQAQIAWDGVDGDTLSSIENAIGSVSKDSLWGNQWANVLDGGAGGADELLGFGGSDTVSYASSQRGVIVDLRAQAAWDGAEADTLGSIENATGSQFDDRLWGDQAANVLDGGAGGADELLGFGGSDTVSYASSQRGVIVDLRAQAAWDGAEADSLESIENAIGSRFDDRLWGDQAANVLDGGAGGADELLGFGGSDTVSYASSHRGVIVDLQAQATWDGADADTLGSIENATGSRFDDRLWGDDGDNVLDGGAGGADELLGFGGSDTVSYASSEQGVIVNLKAQATWDGVEGNTLGSIESAIGSAFADTFFGSAGNNVFSGGAGADIFAMGSTWGADVILDFMPGEDRVHFAAGTFASFDDLIAHTSNAGGCTIIQFDASNTLTVAISASLLTPADFVLV